jgi:preprotein translocase subunit YajC
MAALKVGDKIQTIGGFIGEILVMEEDEFVILSEETKLRVKRNAVAIRLTETEVEEVAAIETTTEEEDEDFQIEDFEI